MENNKLQKQTKWWHIGISFALIMYILMTFILPVINKEKITMKSALIGIPFWTLGGLLYGYITKGLYNRKKTLNNKL
jgi:hypothetical protein